MEADHKHIYKFFFMKRVLTIKNMAMVRNFQDIFDKFNVVGIYTSENYALKWINKLYN
jgi:hypothetical protein